MSESNKVTTNTPLAPQQDIVVELRGITKSFGSVIANDNINVAVKKGTCHAIIGENGAGKSTAMKILYGLYQADRGEIWINGNKVTMRSPREATALGVGMVHQHFMLAGPYSVLDNIILGHEPKGGIPLLGLLDRNDALVKLTKIVSDFTFKVDFKAPIESLPVGLQQRVEILKLLYQDANVLILDEPTAVLTPQETHELFENLKSLKAQGKTIIIITHKLKEVVAISDELTVFRNGKVVTTKLTAKTSEAELAELMVGRKVNLSRPSDEQKPESGKLTLEISDLSLQTNKKQKPLLANIKMQVFEGEIVGIAGVEGNGQDDLIKLINGPVRGLRAQSVLKMFGRDVSRLTTKERQAAGLSVIAPDRHAQALLMRFAVTDNFLLGNQYLSQFVKWGVIRAGALAKRVAELMETFDIRPRNIKLSAASLSGGNQQKLVIARELERSPKLLVAAHPTRGVDIGAIEFIHNRIREVRRNGTAVILVSSELDEILALADRIFVMYEGQFVAHLARSEANEQKLGFFMGGGKS